ncbi:MAG: L-serine ammonia-lyase, iron-sulfur-dependent, subunit alpha, partial [Bacteroidota bacterium]
MTLLFESFAEWEAYCQTHQDQMWQPVMLYEQELRNRSEQEIWDKLAQAYAVMKDAVHTGLTEDMTSLSGMVDNGAKKIARAPISVLGPQFQKLLSYSIAAKEVNSCMGRVVAAPTAGA